MKILFAADLQLEGGQSLGHGECGPGSRFHDQEAMLGLISSTMIAEEIDLVVLAGDTFDRPKPSPWAIRAMQQFVREIPTIILAGNHDIKALALPSILDCLGAHKVINTPQTLSFGPVSLHCLPWLPHGHFSNLPGDRDEANAWIASQLARTAQNFTLDSDARNILVGHWSISGAVTNTGIGVEMFREPVIPLEGLTTCGFDLVAFGHIHKLQALHTDPPVLYLGSPWASNFGEAGDHHGVWIYDTQPATMRYIPISDRPLITFDGVPSSDDLLGADWREAVVRVRYEATEEEARRVDASEIATTLRDLGAHKVFVQPTVVKASRARVEAQAVDGVDDAAAINLFLETDGTDPQRSGRARELHSEFMAQL